MATFVMLFGICSSIIVLQSGFKALDNSRSTTLAAQVIQSELERIRLLPWDTSTEITLPDGTTVLKPAVSRLPARTEVDPSEFFPAGSGVAQAIDRFTVVRTSTAVAGRADAMRTITVTVTWTGMDGVVRSRRSSTQYTKHGLYDYYYTRASS